MLYRTLVYSREYNIKKIIYDNNILEYNINIILDYKLSTIL